MAKARNGLPREPGYPLPDAAAKGMEKVLQSREPSGRLSNFGLAFHRFVKYESDTNPAVPVWSWKTLDTSRQRPRTVEHKPEMWRQIVQQYARQCFSQSTPATKALQSFRDRRKATVDSFTKRFGSGSVQRFERAVGWRLASGLGTANVLENGITLHRVYGFPMIPGSAVKGITRHLAFCRIAEEFEVPALPPAQIVGRKNEKRPRATPWDLLSDYLEADEEDLEGQLAILQRLSDDEVFKELGCAIHRKKPAFSNAVTTFRRAFGTTHQEGGVIFCDALPTSLVVDGEPLVELDIVNPHFSTYYGDGSKAPTDGDNPSLSNFLVVRQGTCFDFLLLSRDAKLLNDIAETARHALSEVGVGAKTSANYGWFLPGGPPPDERK